MSVTDVRLPLSRSALVLRTRRLGRLRRNDGFSDEHDNAHPPNEGDAEQNPLEIGMDHEVDGGHQLDRKPAATPAPTAATARWSRKDVNARVSASIRSRHVAAHHPECVGQP